MKEKSKMKYIMPFSILLLLSVAADSPAITKPTTKESMKKVTLPSKLQYEIRHEIKDDKAKSAQKGKLVTVHYTGWLAEKDKAGNWNEGKKFDSSLDRHDPFQFTLGAGMVIRGWDEGVAGMKVGEKRRLLIPAELGYGSRGAGGIIPPNADLIFDVELLNVG